MSKTDSLVYAGPAQRGFGGSSFAAMLLDDVHADPARYDDICGDNIGHVKRQLDWVFEDWPVTVTLWSASGKPVATGFAAPIRFKGGKDWYDSCAGINLSYAVHSQHEGLGYGLAVSALALIEADQLWGLKLRDDAFLNIQTRQGNATSCRLLEKLVGSLTKTNADFSAKLPCGTVLQYAGARVNWSQALANAEQHLLNMPFLKELVDVEDEPSNFCESPSC